MSQSARESALYELSKLQEQIASKDERYLKALTDAYTTAVMKSNIETRIWFDYTGEMTLACRSLAKTFKEAPNVKQLGVSIVKIVDDPDAVTVTFELSNGSGIKVGLKQFMPKDTHHE
jgi:hypothetical protein